MSELTVTNTKSVRELPFLLRILWFFFFGWEIAAVWILVAWALNISVIGLPFGVWMINRVPQVLTLKARPGIYMEDTYGRERYLKVKQPNFLVRALYFILIGWWFSLLWATLAWLLCLTIIGLTVGVPMLNALPAVTTLQRG